MCSAQNPFAEQASQSSESAAAVAARALEYLEPFHRQRPTVGLILGTGASELAAQLQTDHIIPYADIPGFPTSTVIGHSGNWIIGRLAGAPVVAMQGRFHLYEGWSPQAAAIPIDVMDQLGVRTLLITNAAGGLNPLFRSGDLMVITSHIDLMFRTGQRAWPQRLGRPSLRSDSYDATLAESVQTTARSIDYPCHTGVYAAMLGPTYETRAEYRMLRRIGADAAGMSTVPEVYAAVQRSMQVLGLSIIANTASPDALQETSGEEVIAAAAQAAPAVARIFSRLASDIANDAD